jgi:hypothetical protein
METAVDQILNSPAATADLMDQFMVLTATGHILEDVRYQPAVSSLVVTYRMIGRITNGDYRLPAVAL